jgi:hypothetical protein
MRALGFVAFGLATACDTGSAVVVSRDIDGRVDIGHGVYGQTVIWGGDNEDDGPFALGKVELAVTAVNAGGSAKVTTDDVGFYELALDTGTYDMCTSWLECRRFDVPASGVIRFDYDGSQTGWHTVMPTAGGPDAGTL